MRAGPAPREEPDDEVVPVEDLFDFAEDPVDFMSAESFPFLCPTRGALVPPPSTIAPSSSANLDEKERAL